MGEIKQLCQQYPGLAVALVVGLKAGQDQVELTPHGQLHSAQRPRATGSSRSTASFSICTARSAPLARAVLTTSLALAGPQQDSDHLTTVLLPELQPGFQGVVVRFRAVVAL